MSPQSVLLESIASRLGTIRASIRRLFFLDGVARLAVSLGAFIVVTFLLDPQSSYVTGACWIVDGGKSIP